jgi:hypothetical protein
LRAASTEVIALALASLASRALWPRLVTPIRMGIRRDRDHRLAGDQAVERLRRDQQ